MFVSHLVVSLFHSPNVFLFFLLTMKTNTDHFSSLYYRVRGARSKDLLDGTTLPYDVTDLLNTAFRHWEKNDDETSAFYILELCEAVSRHITDSGNTEK